MIPVQTAKTSQSFIEAAKESAAQPFTEEEWRVIEASMPTSQEASESRLQAVLNSSAWDEIED